MSEFNYKLTIAETGKIFYFVEYRNAELMCRNEQKCGHHVIIENII